ncbi:hypothetical protein M885DRAFT_209082 [Pelagophyceae sp. CCMP2097]|nr:hypothetical protein M885DRAFT_209082 [Pelagophyceae sp. CCMP2097]
MFANHYSAVLRHSRRGDWYSDIDMFSRVCRAPGQGNPEWATRPRFGETRHFGAEGKPETSPGCLRRGARGRGDGQRVPRPPLCVSRRPCVSAARPRRRSRRAPETVLWQPWRRPEKRPEDQTFLQTETVLFLRSLLRSSFLRSDFAPQTAPEAVLATAHGPKDGPFGRARRAFGGSRGQRAGAQLGLFLCRFCLFGFAFLRF